MVKYVEFKKVDTGSTVLEFRGGSEDIRVTNFTGDDVIANIVSIVSDSEVKIDELIANQPSEIGCKEIIYDEFKALVKYSDQIARINAQVKNMIAKRYDIADEIAMGKRAVDDVKRVEYERYVSECIAKGDELKAEIGY